MMDEAEQALNDQYDREVSSFYTDSKLKAASIRSLYEENAIADLFKEDEKLQDWVALMSKPIALF